MRRPSLLILLAILLLSLAPMGRAQELSATLSGTVTDSVGAVIPHASITIALNGVNGTARIVESDGSGNYTATNLTAGTYTVSATAAGFETFKAQNISLNVAEKRVVNVQLKTGSVTTTITVEENPVSVNTETSEQAGTIEGLQVRELEINSRNFTQLVTLQPGVVNMLGDEDSSSFTAMSVNGARGTANNWTVDGADINDSGSNTTATSQPSMEAIQEITLERGNYDAGYGRSGGGQVLVATRSGTSSFHGEGYEYVRTTDFNANDWLNKQSELNLGQPNQPGVYHQNVYGFTIGGPVYIPKGYNENKNKTFFFYSEDWHKISQAGSSTTLTPPTTAEVGGTFAGDIRAQYPQATYDAASNTSTIPASAFSKNAQVYLTNLFDKVANSSGSLTFNQPSTNDYRDDIVRIDHYFNDKVHLYARGINDSNPQVDPSGLWNGAQYPGAATVAYSTPGKNVVGNLTWTISPKIVNELEFAYAQGTINANFESGDFANNPTYVSALTQGQTGAYAFGSDPYGRMPAVTFADGTTGFGAGSDPYGERNLDRTYFDNLSLSLGKHTLRTGFQIQQMIKTENATSGDAAFTFGSGSLNNSGVYVGNGDIPFADFLVGTVYSYSQQSRDTVPDLNFINSEAYINDDWKFNHNLTFNLGVRWSRFPSPWDKNNTLANFDPLLYDASNAPTLDPLTGNFNVGQSIAGNPLVANTYTNGVIFPTNSGHCAAAQTLAGNVQTQVQCSPYGRDVNPNDNTNFAPRVGFAYNPDGHGVTSIRSGFGLFYDRTMDGIWEGNSFADPPITQTVSVSNTTFDSPNPSGKPSASYGPNSLTATGTPIFRVPTYFDYNLTVERQLLPTTVLSVAYVGNQARHLVGEWNENQPKEGDRVAAPANTDVNLLRPYLGYDHIQDRNPIFTSNYNALQISLNHRSNKGLTVGASYTWSKVLTTQSEDRNGDLGSYSGAAIQNSYDIKADYGPASFNQPQSLIVNYVYALPFFKGQSGAEGKLLGGWELSGITTYATGTSLTITQTGDPFQCPTDSTTGLCLTTSPAGTGLRGLGIASYGSARPNQVAPVKMIKNPGAAGWFSTSSFAPATGAWGNLGTGTILGPDFQKWDIALAKNTKIGELVNVQLRVESFDVFNHPNFGSIGTSLGSSHFGQVTSDHEPRLLQMGGKITF
ncbi:MAG: carboxypeptidase regulatory-like domain-containing protein [Terracidiphilus sp.]